MILIEINSQTTLSDVANKAANAVISWFRVGYDISLFKRLFPVLKKLAPIRDKNKNRECVRFRLGTFTILN